MTRPRWDDPAAGQVAPERRTPRPSAGAFADLRWCRASGGDGLAPVALDQVHAADHGDRGTDRAERRGQDPADQPEQDGLAALAGGQVPRLAEGVGALVIE